MIDLLIIIIAVLMAWLVLYKMFKTYEFNMLKKQWSLESDAKYVKDMLAYSDSREKDLGEIIYKLASENKSLRMAIKAVFKDEKTIPLVFGMTDEAIEHFIARFGG